MKRRISIFLFISFCGLLFFCCTAWKAESIHDEYPDPQIHTCQLRETLPYKSYQITFSGWQWGDERLPGRECPGFRLADTGTDGRPEDIRVGLITLSITKVSAGRDILDLADIGFSSGAWGNQFDLELFYMLNPTWDSLSLDLETGSERRVVLPLTMLASQFTAAEWEKIDSRRFYVDIQYYPEHNRFACPVQE